MKLKSIVGVIIIIIMSSDESVYIKVSKFIIKKKVL